MQQHLPAPTCPPLDELRSVHLVGIGGTAMTPLATILLQMGKQVSGSDVSDVPWLARLRELGAHVFIGHDPEHVGDVDAVIISSAVSMDNVEVRAAQARRLPIMKHSAALGSLMGRRRGIAVAGTHGKTTTTALLATVLDVAGADPTFHVGSELVAYGLFGKHGRGDLLVAEADEFDRRFLDYDPELAVVTSVEPDHLDYFGSVEAVVSAFEAFLARIRPGGAAILCADDPVARALPSGNVERTTYGLAPDAHWRLQEWNPVDRDRGAFKLRCPDGTIESFVLGLRGRHNAVNAAAVVAAAAHLGVHMPDIRRGLEAFAGTRRRFEIVGAALGVTIVDDYAHHPTAIHVTLQAARDHFRTAVWAIFQPHTAHRTASLQAEFAISFENADHVLIVPTYRPPGREVEASDPTIDALLAAMHHPDARSLSAADAAEFVAESVQPGDLVLVMGAGDIWQIEKDILAGLQRRSSRPA
ncbi:MAG: UDP-N-acetylmuramate--L-alanine ligase [Chloroflexi bacterium]|nr:UDP-N-acetylmuramate--L-alanine ligase [Chloroflexota bacterium]